MEFYIAISWWVEAKLTLRKENNRFFNWMMGTISTENRIIYSHQSIYFCGYTDNTCLPRKIS